MKGTSGWKHRRAAPPPQTLLYPGQIPGQPRLRPDASGLGLPRARLDLITAALALLAAATCLGLGLLFFAVTGQEFHAAPPKLARWITMALPVGAGVVVVFSFARQAPWFAGAVAASLLWLVPGLSASVQMAAFVALCVLLGQAEAFVRLSGARHRRAGR